MGGMSHLITLAESGGAPAPGDADASALGWIDITQEPYSAASDGKVYSGAVVTAGSAVITCPTGTFDQDDVGRDVMVHGAGASGATLLTTVQSVESATSLTLATNAITASSGTNAGLAIGEDCTAILQEVIDDLAETGGTVYFPPGVYIISGPQVSGTVTATSPNAPNSFTYSGQILFPARAQTTPVATIRFMGATPPGGAQWAQLSGQPPTPSGSILVSSAHTGSVFDAISHTAGNPAGGPSNPVGYTSILPHFECLAIRVPKVANVTAIKAQNCAGLILNRVTIDTAAVINQNPSGTGAGVWLPGYANSALLELRSVQIAGFGTGVILGEHAILDSVIIQGCGVGLTADGNTTVGHLVTLSNCCVQNCDYILRSASGSLPIVGDISEESNAVHIADTFAGGGGGLVGDILIRSALGAGGLTSRGQPFNLNIRRSTALIGSKNQPVYDTFSRAHPNATEMDLTDNSNHWYKTFDPLVAGVVSGKAAPSSSYGVKACLIPKTWRKYAVSGQIQLGTTKACLGYAIRCPASGNYLGAVIKVGVGGTPNEVIIMKQSGYTTLATSATLALTLGSTVDFAVVWDQAVRAGAATVRAYVNGVEVVTYSLSAGEITTYVDNDYAGLLYDVPVSGADDKSSRWLNLIIDRA